MARLAVAHTRAVTKGPPHLREGWKIRVGSFDSPPLTNGIGKLLYPTVNQDGEVIAGLVAIPEAAVHKFCPDAPSLRRNCAAGPPPLTSDCEGGIIAWSIRIGGHVMGKSLRHPIYLGFLGSGGIL